MKGTALALNILNPTWWGLQLIKSVNNSFVCFQSYSEDGKSAAAEKMAQEWRKKYTLIILYCYTVLYLYAKRKSVEKNSETFMLILKIMFMLQKCSFSKNKILQQHFFQIVRVFSITMKKPFLFLRAFTNVIRFIISPMGRTGRCCVTKQGRP
jgi:hypothetical protein